MSVHPSPSSGAAADGVPFGDPYWYNSTASPYYKTTHVEFRDRMRAFVDKEIIPFVAAWDEAGEYDPSFRQKAYDAGVLAPCWPAEYGGTPPPDFDAFHDLIWIDELSRCGAGGMLWSVFTGFGIALPPVLAHGSQAMKDKVCRAVITGEKIMSLAVSEPWAGSDVANLQTTAARDGDHYIVNGAKKWITGGTRAQFFTTAVRTGGPGMKGLSLLLVEAPTPGLTITRMQTQGWWMSSTAYLEFDDVRVPVENLIGMENDGFKYIMSNFNHERFVLAAQANRYARLCIEEAIRYARVRKTFGKRLIDHQAIRHKIAEMTSRVEATHALLEQIAFQMTQQIPDSAIAGVIALSKVQSTKNMEYCAREASQIFGGSSYVRGGKGAIVERLYREVRVMAIGGGSEEVMLDLAMRQARL